MIPAFVLFRDRVTYARRVVARLRATGRLEVHIIDLGSTWPDALDWLAEERGAVWASMTRDPRNPTAKPKPFGHPYELWTSGLLRWLLEGRLTGPYLVTDCDVLPPEGPPWIGILETALDQHAGIIKAGLALSLDMPTTTAHRDEILSWERQYWRIRLPCGCYTADTDTTLALYRPLPALVPDGVDRYPGVGPAVRVSPDMAGMALHLPWHETETHTGELRYYRDHINEGVTHWTAKTT